MCIHGGLTPLLTKIENINTQIQRPIKYFEENLLLSDLVWSDPSPNLPTFYGESQRGRGKVFNGPVVVNFLKVNNLKRIIRGHQCVKNGIEKLFNDKLITVFSASSYTKENGNSSGILKIYQKTDKIEPIIFNPLFRLKKFDTNYFRVQSFNHQTKKKNFKFFSLASIPLSMAKNSNFFPSKLNKSTTAFNGRKPKVALITLPMLKSGPRKRNQSVQQDEIAKSNIFHT